MIGTNSDFPLPLHQLRKKPESAGWQLEAAHTERGEWLEIVGQLNAILKVSII